MQKFTVTRVEVANSATGETFSVPGMVLTLAQLRAVVECGHKGYTAQCFCDECGESVADCPKTAALVSAPAHWSFRN